MRLKIAILPGDGVGPEVTSEAVKVLRKVAQEFGHELSIKERLIGGRALDETGAPLPKETIDECLSSRAVLLGAVGGPEYDSNPRGNKPEDGLLALRRELGGFANLRPISVYDDLAGATPFKPDLIKGCDILIVRELLGGLYYGTPRGFESGPAGMQKAYNTMEYTEGEIERVAHIAFKSAIDRRRRVTSVDKSNVLEVSQLWRKVVTRVGRDYPQVELEHLLVDTCAMRLIACPSHFDVVLAENLFGDILSDEAAVIAGSIGMLPSASIGGRANLYEPVHGSAPDIAGEGKANPIGAIASAALLLRYSYGLEAEARSVERAIASVISQGLRTADISGKKRPISTGEMGDAISRAITGQQLGAGSN
jgi:3-isopropylmalate dehydrogenase